MVKKIVVGVLILVFMAPLVRGQKHIKWMNKGVAELKKGNPNEALVYLNKSIANKDNYYLSYYNRAVVKDRLNDTAGLILDLNKAISLNPKDYGSLTFMTQIFYSKAKYADVVQWAMRAHEANKNGIEALVYLGDAYAFSKDYKSADLYLSKAYSAIEDKCKLAPYLASIKSITGDKENAKSLFNSCRNGPDYDEDYKMREALFYYSINEDKKAEQLISQVDPAKIKHKGFLSVFYFYEGNNQLFKGNYMRAIHLYHTSQQYGDHIEEVYLNRSLSYARLGEYPNALADIDSYIKLNPSDTAYKNKASYLTEMGEYEKAITNMRLAEQVKVQDDTFYVRRARLLMRMKNAEEATLDLRKAIKVNSKSAMAYFELAQIQEDDLSFKRYMTLIDSALKYDAGLPEAVEQKFLFYIDEEKYKSANRLLINGINTGMDSAFFFYLKSILAISNEQMTLGLNYLNQTLEYDSLFLRAYLIKAELLEEEGSLKQASRTLKRLLKIAPKELSRGFIYINLGKYATRLKRHEEACKYYKLAREEGEEVSQGLMKLNKCN